MDAKKVTFISPRFFGYDTAIRDEMKSAGLEILHLDDRPQNTNLFKIFLRLRLYFFINKIIDNHRASLINQIKQHNSQYLFLLNTEVVNTEMINSIKELIPDIKIIFYLWDSIRNRKNSPQLIEISDIAYSFDKGDCLNTPKLVFQPLFYEEIFQANALNKRQYDLSFIGTYHSNRYELFKYEKIKINFFLHLYVQGFLIKIVRAACLIFKPQRLKNFWKLTTLKTLSKFEIAEILKNSNAVIDFQHPGQIGLTCRTFEALASGCKLITSNKDIVTYDFYDPAYIYVMNGINDIPLDFIATHLTESEFQKMQKNISPYALKNWVENILLKNL